MAVDPAYGNSSGYFRDPTNGEDLSVDTPRVIPCELKDGKFVWPQVAASDGSMLLKIVYKLFTDEEKSLYKQYRGRSPSAATEQKSHVHKEPKVRAEKQVVNDTPVRAEKQVVNDTPVEVVKYNEHSAVAADTAEVIASCDQCIGCSMIGDLTYALLSCRGSNIVYHIPRDIISDSDFARLCGGV